MKLKQVYDPAFFMARSLPPGDRDPPTNPISPKSAAACQIDSYHEVGGGRRDPSEAERAARVWLQNTGLVLKPETIRKHLNTLRRWHGRVEPKDGNLA